MAAEDALLPIESEMLYSLHLAVCCLNRLCASPHASPSAACSSYALHRQVPPRCWMNVGLIKAAQLRVHFCAVT